MQKPGENPEPQLEPQSVAKLDATIGSNRATALEFLKESLNSADSKVSLKKLQLLTGNDKDETLVGAYISLIASREGLSSLAIWAEECDAAAHLELLAREVWNQHGLSERLKTVQPHQLVKREMRGRLPTQYLASMATASRPALTEEIAQFVQRLRILLLVRATQALDSRKAIREKNIAEVSTLVRKVCDISADLRGNWLAAVASEEIGLYDFCQDLRIRCEIEVRRDSWPPDAKSFFKKLQVVANGGPWEPTLLVSEIQKHSSQESEVEPITPNGIGKLLTEGGDDGHIVLLGKGTKTSVAIRILPANEKQTPAKNKLHGSGVILESVEEMQFLRTSWHHLSTSEDRKFDEWTHQLSASDNSEIDQLGAAILQIAFISSRTAFEVETVPISDMVLNDWSIHPTSGQLHRKPPTFVDGWNLANTTDSINEWINPRLLSWNLSLAEKSTDVLVAVIARHPTSKCLGELWTHLSPGQSFEKWFRQKIAQVPDLARITGPTLAHILMVRTYQRTHNQGLTRLIGSQTRTGLPAACAYGAYRGLVVYDAMAEDVRATVPQLFKIISPASNDNLTACGSNLDILLPQVRLQIDKLIQSVNNVSNNSEGWIEYHNKLVSLLVIAVYASTGGRPVNSPFESLAWFDFERKIVFLEDKVLGPTQSARVCVLSQVAQQILQEVYLPHIAALEGFLCESAPLFSAEIRKVRTRDPEAQLPLFFFLKLTPKLDWIEVTETQLTIESQIAWPLPWNLFRHIHATELVRRGLNHEIVDALLSHGDRGAESHGDLSLRIPSTDLETARPLVESIQIDLGFAVPKSRKSFPTTAPNGDPSLHSGRVFGRKARQLQRVRRQDAARQRALHEIETAIGKKPLDSISPEEWERIGRDMLIREGGFPHSAASLRYEVFESFVDSIWKQKRRLTRMRRTYSVLPEPISIFNESCIDAPAQLQTYRERFETIVASVKSATFGPVLAATLAALDMVLYSRISFFNAMKSLVTLQKNIKIIKFQGCYWFEWSDADVWHDGRPMFRVRISSRAANWVATSQLSSKTLTKFPALPAALHTYFPFEPTPGGFVALMRDITSLQDQLNAWELHGTDSAHLNGRLIYSALPHADWYRLHKLAAPLLARESDVDKVCPLEDIYFMRRHHLATQSKAATSSPEKCAQLFDEIYRIVSSAVYNVDTKRAKIEDQVRQSDYGHGDIPFVFGQFMLHLLKRKPKNGQRDGLRLDTVGRYFHSLAAPMCELGHDANIADMNEEEITDFYCDILEWWTDHFENISPISKEDVAKLEDAPELRLTPQERADDAARRTLIQLKELHEFAIAAFGVEEPDWSQISNGNIGSLGRPGFVLDNEYRLALKSITNDRDVGEISDFDITQCFTLVACARFGLRIGESVGLYTDDWVEIGGAIVLLVRANPVRALKTPSSRRQVPLIGPLDSLERAVVDEVFRRAKNALKLGASGPLFPNVATDSFKQIKNTVGTEIRTCLRLVTKNAGTTVHMLRHSFASRILAILRGQALGAGESFSPFDTIAARKLLLGSDQLDRRTLWAVGRLLGHKNPRVTARCYLHGMDTWISPGIDGGEWTGEGPGARALVDLDKLATIDGYGQKAKFEQREEAIQESQLLRLLKCLRLLQQGVREFEAVKLSRVAAIILNEFNSQVNGSILAHSKNSRDSNGGQETAGMIKPFSWPISVQRFDSLILLVARCEEFEATDVTFDLSETIGKRRQIVLFQKEHFIAASRFSSTLNLMREDVSLVASNAITQDQEKWLADSSVGKLQRPKSEFGSTFQLDSAISGPLQLQVNHRAVLLPTVRSKAVHTTYELLLLWIGWYACQVGAKSNSTTANQMVLPLF